jgi:hypothetical protein
MAPKKKMRRDKAEKKETATPKDRMEAVESISGAPKNQITAFSLKCFLDEEKDQELILKAKRGEIVSSLIYPLLFDAPSNPDDVEIFYRSLPFLRSLATGTASVAYGDLNQTTQHFVHIGIRDLYFASIIGSLSDDDQETLLRVTDLIPDSESYSVDGLSLSFHPSMNRKLLKYISLPCQYLETTHSSDFFIQPTAPLPSSASSSTPLETTLRAVFVDPRDLSYHNFESIVRLDSWFQNTNTSSQLAQYTTTYPHQLDPNYEIFVLNLHHPSALTPATDPLHQLDQLDLYTPPLNSSTRGGNRFIFQSHALSDQVTQLIHSSGILDLMSPSYSSSTQKYLAKDSFITVNSVFRLNKFEPTDRDFETHLDTPYSDPAHRHYSRYSLLLYLSDGNNENTLSFEENKVCLNEIKDLTCVIFRQDYEHRGRPFLHSKKIFLRTELIFFIEDETVLKVREESKATRNTKKKITPVALPLDNGIKGIRYDARVGRLFSSAVYFTGQSIYEPELAAYAHKCYELSNRLHWNRQLPRGEEPTATEGLQLQLLFKKLPICREPSGEKDFYQFVTCGSDYWFQRQVGVPLDGDATQESKTESDASYLKECALFTLLDYFNCTLQKRGTPFRSLCETKILSPPSPPPATFEEYESFISSVLTEFPSPTKGRKNYLSLVWKTAEDIARIPFLSQKPLLKPNPKNCCPFHCSFYDEEDWNEDDAIRMAGKVPCLNRYYHTCRAYAENKLKDSNLFMNWLGTDLVLNRDSFLVEGDKIYVLHKTGQGKEGQRLEQDGQGQRANRVNFAACWNGGSMDSYVSLEETINSHRLLIPPISFHSSTDAHGRQQVHLMMDFFQNSWSVTRRERELPIPHMAYTDEDATGSFRAKVNAEYFEVDWDESSWEETYGGSVSRVDLDGDIFIPPCHSNTVSSDEESSDEDSA